MPLALSPLDLTALIVFAVAWLAYEPLLKAAARGKGAINTDMTVIRVAWMKNMAGRENKFMDGQLLGHALNSASFFASSNLILIAGAAGVLFGGESTFRSASSLVVIQTSTRLVFELQIALVLVALARGLLDFIWSIRQMNYCIAAVGAAPDSEDAAFKTAYGEAAARLLNPALSAFNAGVRGYYFALAAAAWLFGPIAFLAATLGAVSLLLWRQRRSKAAGAIADLRKLLGG
ncbi:DUF599 domain-containing protein [Phenylobacterium sp.]|uniref:DUF599 domain-containing protein n=1 Tax=Phenylobacterium sp. TaxID=1871053 RepID=UPI0027216A8C|nr:DUF599 family protein [Phenylobacterium sp.]MDO8802617.1 DUF599 family protein [Phenylobacterium sp.]